MVVKPPSLLPLLLLLFLLHTLHNPHRNPILILTASNRAYLPLLLNLHCALSTHSTEYRLISLDTSTNHTLTDLALPTLPYTQESPGQYLYNTRSYNRLTRHKSRIVLTFLEKGYDVLWIDADITLHQHPLPFLQSLNGDLLVMSNAPPGMPNTPGRINSGFYLARSTHNLINAFRAIASSTSPSSEQAIFNRILCHTPHTLCKHPNIDIVFLDPHSFANGLSGWGRVVTHHNWCTGVSVKLHRAMKRDWRWNDTSKSCIN